MLRLRISSPIPVPGLAVLAFGLLLIGARAFAAGPNSANLTVTIVDKSKAYVPEASSVLVNMATGLIPEQQGWEVKFSVSEAWQVPIARP
jgi:hypothetical protein